MKCSICGNEYSEASLGGPGICPSCDCGAGPNWPMGVTSLQFPFMSPEENNGIESLLLATKQMYIDRVRKNLHKIYDLPDSKGERSVHLNDTECCSIEFFLNLLFKEE